MNKELLDKLWVLYRQFCESEGDSANFSGKIESAVAFMKWLKKKV